MLLRPQDKYFSHYRRETGPSYRAGRKNHPPCYQTAQRGRLSYRADCHQGRCRPWIYQAEQLPDKASREGFFSVEQWLLYKEPFRKDGGIPALVKGHLPEQHEYHPMKQESDCSSTRAVSQYCFDFIGRVPTSRTYKATGKGL